MSTKQLIRLAVVLAVVLVAWGALSLARGSSADNGASFTLPTIDTASVDTIALSAPRDSEVLVRDAHGQWRVNDYPAAPALVSSLLKALDDTAARSELVAEQPASHAQLGVSADSGRHVRVVSGGRTVLDAITGKRTDDYSGVYVRLANANSVYALHGTLVEALSHHGVDAWRDKRIAALDPAQVATIAVRHGAHSYTLHRKTGGQWTFTSGRAADSAAVGRLLDAYHPLTASGFATAAQADSAHFTHPRLHAQLLGADDTPLVSLAFDSTASGVWARADSGGTVYRLDTWRLGQLLPAESSLRAQRSAAKPAAKGTTGTTSASPTTKQR